MTTQTNQQRQKGQDIVLAEIQKDISYMRTDVNKIQANIVDGLVTNERADSIEDRLSLLEKAVYGFIALVLVLVLTAIVGSRIK